MSRADVLSLQGLKRYKSGEDPIGSNVSVSCKTHSGLSLFFCVIPR
ncbi:class III lanthipeptide [Bacillus sp. JCM 19041]